MVSWLVGVDCDARLRDANDGLGNAVTMLYAEGPIEALDITVTGEVLTSEASGVVRGAREPLPPLFYLRPTPRTGRSDALSAFAADIIEAGATRSSSSTALNAALRARFPCYPICPTPAVPPPRRSSAGKASSRDVAQMFIAAVRGPRGPGALRLGLSCGGCRAFGPARLGRSLYRGAGLGRLRSPRPGSAPTKAMSASRSGSTRAAPRPPAACASGRGRSSWRSMSQVGRLGAEE